MKTLHFDARFIRLDHHDGISRFSVELIHALSKKIEVIAIVSELKQIAFLPKGTKHILVNPPESITEFWIARKLNKQGVKNVYSPMQIMGSFGRKYRLVLTLHDLIYYRHRTPPQDLSLPIRLIWRLYHLSFIPQRLLLNRADAVVTVSATTKKLIEKYQLTKRPVSVVYNAASVSAGKPRKYPTGKNLVYIGSFMPYKNVEALIRGVGLKSEYTLHLLSKIDAGRKVELTKLAKANQAKVEFHNGVSDQEYLELLQNACALVTASQDEGFGIPLVEAMSQGTPVIVSDLDIFREVADNSGTYFDPNRPGDFADKLTELEDKENWLLRSSEAIKQAQKFNWDKSATELLEIFNRLETSD